MLIDNETSEICRTLLQRTGQGDTVAFAELYDRTAPAVYGLIRSVLPDVEEAEDVTFEVYVQAWRTASQYDPGRDDASCLLLATARRYVLDRIRTAPAPVGASGSHRTVPCEEVADPGGCRSCAQLLAAVPVASRDVLVWAYCGGQSLVEAAELLGITEAAAISRLGDALASLRHSRGSHSADVPLENGETRLPRQREGAR
ncbi:hypothetical protein Amsp01_088110 [Amycolatopsis sp. NBRC 101858]|uniref:sigma factor n=1 Tax=Amycolatopsis sp. NBRC 101858 TaxID=3032200 RepID=UPI0024A0CB3A|nr:sigma factor [Amycolatopsis sp. NBRC 101858]GLY42788.1 hypothetical protein Amsp01_088110 [Amycolatopsis sp. NBRC 101858]